MQLPNGDSAAICSPVTTLSRNLTNRRRGRTGIARPAHAADRKQSRCDRPDGLSREIAVKLDELAKTLDLRPTQGLEFRHAGRANRPGPGGNAVHREPDLRHRHRRDRQVERSADRIAESGDTQRHFESSTRPPTRRHRSPTGCWPSPGDSPSIRNRSTSTGWYRACPTLHRLLGEAIAVETVPAAGLWWIWPTRTSLKMRSSISRSTPGMPCRTAASSPSKRRTPIWARPMPSNDVVVPGQYAMIAVSDSGNPHDPETAAQAFEPFFTTKDIGQEPVSVCRRCSAS